MADVNNKSGFSAWFGNLVNSADDKLKAFDESQAAKSRSLDNPSERAKDFGPQNPINQNIKRPPNYNSGI